MSEDPEHDPLGWWVISGTALMEALVEVSRGANPHLVFAELYANSDHEDP